MSTAGRALFLYLISRR